MGFVAFVGPLLLGTGPLIAIFCLFIARKSFVVLLTLASAFYWLSVLLGLGCVFRAFAPLPEETGARLGAVVVGVLVEQSAKYGLFRVNGVLVRIMADIGRRTGHGFTSIDALWLSFGFGFGHAMTHSTFFFVSMLEATSTGATHYDFVLCPQLSFFVASALITLGLSLFHAFSTVVFFDGLSSKNRFQSIAPPLTHLAAALLTVVNLRKNGCMATIPIVLFIGIVYVVWATSICWHEIKIQFPNRTIQNERH